MVKQHSFRHENCSRYWTDKGVVLGGGATEVTLTILGEITSLFDLEVGIESKHQHRV